jgi:hypothetical protein
MWKSEIKPGVQYAIREKRIRGTPFQRVRIISHIRGNKWKAEWIDPNPGLVHFVESGHLIVPWREHKAFLKEERNEARLEQHNETQGHHRNSPVDRALEQIFETIADDVGYGDGVVCGSPAAVDRVTTRACLETGKHSPVSYADRTGNLNLPFDEALELGRRICAAEPSTVLLAIESTERDWTQRTQRGETHLVSLLNEYRASWALIRQWAGLDAAVAQREAEIQRLERLVWDEVYALQKAGLDSEANRLRRAVQRRE